jgi:Arc/MetJ family transcription regulator
MKTTIEIDEGKLDRIMKLTGIGTMKEAVDWALSEALRLATINRVMEGMTARGWFLRPMARPAAIHMGMITLHQGPAVEPYLRDVAEVVAAL